MGRIAIVTMGALLFTACTSRGYVAPPQNAQPPSTARAWTEPIAVGVIDVAVPSGAEVGKSWKINQLVTVPLTPYRWGANASIAPAALQAAAAEQLRTGRYDVVDQQPRFVLSGTVRSLAYDTYSGDAPTRARAKVKVDWNLQDAKTGQSAWSGTSEQEQTIEGESSATSVIPAAVQAALAKALGDEKLRAIVRKPAAN